MSLGWWNPVHAGTVGVVAFLVLASGIVAWKVRRHPERSHGELQLRIRTWWLVIGFFFLGVGFDPKVGVAVFALLSLLAFNEFVALVPNRPDRRVLLWAYLAVPIQYYWVGSAWYGMFILFIPVYVFLFLSMRLVMLGETRGFLHAAGTLHWGLMTTVFSLSHMAYLLNLPPRPTATGTVVGAMLVFYLIVLTQLNDVAQYIWGKSFGRRQVIPQVSPGKTIEGLVGGVATTVLLAWGLARWFTPLNDWQALACGLLIGLGGFAGDLVVSAIKRDVGVKDSGDMLPGHGGLLDRLDSLTFTAPLFFHYISYLHYTTD